MTNSFFSVHGFPSYIFSLSMKHPLPILNFAEIKDVLFLYIEI